MYEVDEFLTFKKIMEISFDTIFDYCIHFIASKRF